VAPANVEKSPYSETETGELNHAFLRLFLDKKHPELKERGHEAFNKEVLLRWHVDSGLSILTMASLDRAFQECSALQFFAQRSPELEPVGKTIATWLGLTRFQRFRNIVIRPKRSNRPLRLPQDPRKKPLKTPVCYDLPKTKCGNYTRPGMKSQVSLTSR
jgi:hypothetical protein